jgi:hypothetical protein
MHNVEATARRQHQVTSGSERIEDLVFGKPHASIRLI